MLEIYICDDQKQQLETMVDYVEKAILMKNWDTKIVCANTDPKEILNTVRKTHNTGIYFLDIELNSDMNGLELAKKIRKYDPRGFIVLVTSHIQYMPMIFKNKLEIMDYIEKDSRQSIREQVVSCLENAWEKYQDNLPDDQKYITINTDSISHCIPISDIYYIDKIKATHLATIHTADGTHALRSGISQIQSQLPEYFIRVHNACIVNSQYIEKIDHHNRKVFLKNGHTCPLSVRESAHLKKNGRHPL